MNALSTRIRELRHELKSRSNLLAYGFGQSAICGTFTAEAHHKEMPMPLAIVWFSFTGSVCIQILHSYVNERYRRCGLRTYLHERILAAYPDVNLLMSQHGTAAGEAWMLATGYTKGPLGWEFHRQSQETNR